MKIKYVAFDDNEFDSKKECEAYEAKHKKMISEIIGLTEEFERTTDFEYNAYYIFAPSKDSINFLSCEYGLENLSIGWNIYDEDEDIYWAFEDFKNNIESQYSDIKESDKVLKDFSHEKKAPEYDVFYTTDFTKGHLEITSLLDLPEVFDEINKIIDKNDNNMDIQIRKK